MEGVSAAPSSADPAPDRASGRGQAGGDASVAPSDAGVSLAAPTVGASVAPSDAGASVAAPREGVSAAPSGADLPLVLVDSIRAYVKLADARSGPEQFPRLFQWGGLWPMQNLRMDFRNNVPVHLQSSNPATVRAAWIAYTIALYEAIAFEAIYPSPDDAKDPEVVVADLRRNNDPTEVLGALVDIANKYQLKWDALVSPNLLFGMMNIQFDTGAALLPPPDRQRQAGAARRGLHDLPAQSELRDVQSRWRRKTRSRYTRP